ncbi:MAG: aldose epimerase family protein [Pirellulaceae bacterium]
MPSDILAIADSKTGATVRLLPGLGCNCFQFQVPTAAGPRDLLWSQPGFELANQRASGSGLPILFPFPGRIQGTTLRWRDRDYPLEPGDGRGNAIHGFVHERPWRVALHEASRVVAEFHAATDDPQLLERWPADFRITATYEISGTRLSAHYLLENPDQHDLPCGFGTHPYFRVPVGGTTAANCRIRLPVASRWELIDMNPTGRKIKIPLDDRAFVPQGEPLGDRSYDDVFSDLAFRDGHCQCRIEDPASDQCIVLTFDRAFRECVVYTPPHREAICIEPYTCVPDPFRLQRQGIPAGLRVLAPGEAFQARMEIALLDGYSSSFSSSLPPA